MILINYNRNEKKVDSVKNLFISSSVIYHMTSVVQYIPLCHKNRMATRVITLWRVHCIFFLNNVHF